MSVIPRIGIDAMGGDLGPSVVAAGTVLAFREMPGRFSVTLVGDEAEIRPALRRAKHLNFIGNVEGRDVFNGSADVIVTDGFTGNVLLKTAESVAGLLVDVMRKEIKQDPLAVFGTLFMRGAMRRMRVTLDAEEHGAAPLLGVNGVCFIGHGSSGPRAFRSAIRTITSFVENRVNEHIREEIQSDHETAA